MHLLFKLNKIYPYSITFPPQKNFVTSGPTTAVSSDTLLMVHGLKRKGKMGSRMQFLTTDMFTVLNKKYFGP